MEEQRMYKKQNLCYKDHHLVFQKHQLLLAIDSFQRIQHPA